MNFSELCKSLDATPYDADWSRGAVREDGVVLLQAWRDEVMVFDKRRHVKLFKRKAFDDSNYTLSQWERLAHIKQVKNGSITFVVMVVAVDRTNFPRNAKSIDHKNLYFCGPILEKDSNIYIELLYQIKREKIESKIDRLNIYDWENDPELKDWEFNDGIQD